MGQIPLMTTIKAFDPDHSYFTQKLIHVRNIINLGQKIMEFEFGNESKLNVQVIP